MQTPDRIARAWVVAIVTALMMTWTMAPEPAAAQSVAVSGSFHVMWGDPHPDSHLDPVEAFAVIDDQGQWTSVAVDEALTKPFGGALAFDRKRVNIVGDLMRQPLAASPAQPIQAIQAGSIQFERPMGAAAGSTELTTGAAISAAPLAVAGPQPWVTILCRFADASGVTPHGAGWFTTLMGASSPGMDYYWREVSYGNVNLTGSVVVGWYNLPQPRSYYVDPVTGANLQRLLDDCTAVADADVFFPNFVGINLMFNETLDCCAWGGSSFLNRDGQGKLYHVAWMPPWGYNNQRVLGHEMGHGFGLPHSSGPYNTPYDSQWDVMSDGGTCSPPDASFGCLGVHTISYHKDKLGWIPASRKFVSAPGSSQTLVLERLGEPVSSTNQLMAQIPIGGSATQFYTVEARRFAGYDTQVPGEAIVIHKVDTTLPDRQAQVVDVDGNGWPNDAAAMWTIGETFIDLVNEIAVSVDAVTATGFQVTITNGLPPTGSGADLTGSWLSVVQGCKGAGATQRCTLTGKIEVRNQGTQKAGKSSLRFCLSSDHMTCSTDTPITKSVAVGTLKPGKTQKKTLRVRLPTGQSASGKYLLAVIDANTTVPESDKTNNMIVFGPLP